MTEEKNAYDILAGRMGAPGSVRFARILAAMMSPDEADILVKVDTPMTLEEIASKTHINEDILKPKLDDMEERQVIRKMDDRYVTPSNIVMFHHGAIGWMREDLKKKVYPLWDDFFFEEWRDIIVDGFIKRKEAGLPGAHRIIPAHQALKISPKIKPEDILWYEDMEQILRRSERTSFMMCGCRGLWRKCDNPIDVCLQVQFPPEDGEYKGESHQYIKPPKDVSFKEALEVINECEDRGLVHIPLNTSHGDLICNCCDDCCMVINPMLHRGGGVIWEILTPSRYRAVANNDLCVGCGYCSKRCKFDAIKLVEVPDSDRPKGSIINERCLGCGACVVKCPKGALTLELVRPPEHIPTISVMELMTGRMNAPGN